MRLAVGGRVVAWALVLVEGALVVGVLVGDVEVKAVVAWAMTAMGWAVVWVAWVML